MIDWTSYPLPSEGKVAAARALIDLGCFPLVLHGVVDGACTCGSAKCAVKSHGKHPFLDFGWQKADLDTDTLFARFKARPELNLGWRMGLQPNGTRILAIDDDAGLAAMEAKIGKLPQTLQQRTGSGGAHKFFTVPLDVKITNSVKLEKFEVDLRCDGAQCVFAPSSTVAGRYSLNHRHPIAALPQAWLDVVVRRPEPAAAPPAPRAVPLEHDQVYGRARRWVQCTHNEPSLEHQGGHGRLYYVATGLFWGFAPDLPEADAWELFREFNSLGDPESERQLQHKASDAAAGKSTKHPRGWLLHARPLNGSGGRSNGAAREPRPANGLGGDVVTFVAADPATTGEPSEPSEPPGKRSQEGREDWRTLLEYNAGSKERPPTPKRCLANVLTTLLHCPEWGGVLRYDEFADRVVVAAELPHAAHHEPESSRGVWREGHALWTVSWFGDVLGFEPSIDFVQRAIDEVARSNGYHPVREYLRGLRWDGSPRLDGMFVDYFGAEDSEVVRTVAAKWMISCVARVMRPGCQVDHLLVLEGVQGTRKSTALRVLVGDDWFRNSPMDLRNKDAAMALRGCWVYEFDELDAFRGRDATRIKSFITLRKDSYRPAYGKLTIDVQRQCAFTGSTNEERYLVDPTGNRRFWPVRCGAIDIPGLAAVRDQLWAEAYARYSAGELWYVDDPALEAQLRAAQSEREEIDPWTALLQTWLGELFEGTRSKGVTTEQALVSGLELKPGQTTRRDEMRVAVCLRGLGWVRQREQRGGARQYRYFPPEPEIALPA